MRILVILYIIMSTGNLGCGKEEDYHVDPEPEPKVYNLELRYDGDRLTFTQIALPNNVFNVTSGNQSFVVEGLVETNDVRVTLIYDCDTGKQENLSEEVLVNFYEDTKTVIEITSVLICNPDIKVFYE